MKKKMNFSSAIEGMSLGKRIKTIQLLDYCIDHTWTMIPILGVNLAFT